MPQSRPYPMRIVPGIISGANGGPALGPMPNPALGINMPALVLTLGTIRVQVAPCTAEMPGRCARMPEMIRPRGSRPLRPSPRPSVTPAAADCWALSMIGATAKPRARTSRWVSRE